MGSDLARAWAEAAGASGSPVVVMGGRAGWRPVGQTCQGDPGGTSRRARGAQFTGHPLRSGVGVGPVSRRSCCHSRGMVPAEAGDRRGGTLGKEVPHAAGHLATAARPADGPPFGAGSMVL